MRDNPVVLKGESTLHLLRKVKLETLRQIVDDLRDATFGDEYVYTSILARQVLDSRELTHLEAADTLVSDVLDD